MTPRPVDRPFLAMWHPATIAAGLLALAAAACLHRPPPPGLEDPPLPVGQVAATFVPDPEARAHLPEGEEIQAPIPDRENRLPIYPPRPLRSGHGRAAILVRIVVGPDGRVESIGDSPLRRPPRGPFDADFRAAVEEAVRLWRFEPAVHRVTGPGGDLDGDGRPDYRRLLDSRPIPFYLDVRFDFSVEDGRGTVRSAPAAR